MGSGTILSMSFLLNTVSHVAVLTKNNYWSINRVHHNQLVSSEQLLPLMDRLRKHSKEQVTKLRVSNCIILASTTTYVLLGGLC